LALLIIKKKEVKSLIALAKNEKKQKAQKCPVCLKKLDDSEVLSDQCFRCGTHLVDFSPDYINTILCGGLI
jgi:hypothetical protein